MVKTEEEIIQEALELVRHAMSLVDLKLYDDAIQILRQATRLYEQTDLEAEKNALRRKIAEIYTLKEATFNQSKVKLDMEQLRIDSSPILQDIEVELNKGETEGQIKESELLSDPDKLIKEAEEFIALNRFEEALDSYDEALKLLNLSNRISEVDGVYKLIEQCYVQKAKVLRNSKAGQNIVEASLESEKVMPSNNLTEKKEKITEKVGYEAEIQELKVVEDKYKREFEEEDFQKKITSMVDKAENMARNYETNKLKSLKNGHFEETCVYPDVIVIYNEVYNLLIERQWVDQAKFYANQIAIYKEKLARDINIREIEAMKAQKDKEFENFMKSDKIKRTLETGSEKMKAAEEKLKKDIEDETFQNFITKAVNDTERLVRDYEMEIKKGNFEAEPPYQRVIDIYTEIRQNLIDRQWLDQIDIYTNQIRLYQSKMEQDNKLRAVEAQKREKEKAYLDSLKLQKQDTMDTGKIGMLSEKYKDELEGAKFQNLITSLIEEADKMDRDYESKKKKAIKEKNLLELESPYFQIIEIYEKIKNMLLEKGWNNQAAIYTSQISVFQEKFERDKILREIEAHKLRS